MFSIGCCCFCKTQLSMLTAHSQNYLNFATVFYVNAILMSYYSCVVCVLLFLPTIILLIIRIFHIGYLWRNRQPMQDCLINIFMLKLVLIRTSASELVCCCVKQNRLKNVAERRLLLDAKFDKKENISRKFSVFLRLVDWNDEFWPNLNKNAQYF